MSRRPVACALQHVQLTYAPRRLFRAHHLTLPLQLGHVALVVAGQRRSDFEPFHFDPASEVRALKAPIKRALGLGVQYRAVGDGVILYGIWFAEENARKVARLPTVDEFALSQYTRVGAISICDADDSRFGGGGASVDAVVCSDAATTDTAGTAVDGGSKRVFHFLASFDALLFGASIITVANGDRGRHVVRPLTLFAIARAGRLAAGKCECGAAPRRMTGATPPRPLA